MTIIINGAADTIDLDSGGATVQGGPFTINDLQAVDQTVTAIDKTVLVTPIVDAFIYDTAKDSDGGAWRHRCGHTSWEAETLSGNWLGSAANETAARAISGATTGSYYYDTTAAGFYTLNAGSGKTATYRGNTRQFPAKVLITVEAARVVLWDLTQAACPMWMVFEAAVTKRLYGTSISAVGMLNGALVAGALGARGLTEVNFVTENALLRDSGYSYTDRKPISERNSTSGHWVTAFSGVGAIVNSTVNDVAMTVLPNAPVDVATDLPIPVIDVFTDAGTSRINPDGTVADLADTAGDDHKAGCILASGDSVALNSTNGNVDIYKLSNTLADTLTPDRTYDQATTPALLEAVDAGDKVVAMKHRLAIGQDNGVNVLIENPASVAAGMIAYVTKDYNSGWQVGAIKGAWLADTVAETVTGTELVTNGTFDTDTTGWSTNDTSTFAVAAGQVTVTNNGVAAGKGFQAITTVVGKTYTVSADLISISAGFGRITWRNDAPPPGDTVGATASAAAAAKLSFTFVATATTTYLVFGNRNDSGASSVWDNITCRLADVDRSVKAKGLQIFGSLTKAAVASGAQLMGYSGFSAANYLEQPYNSDLDFGTGDFCYMGWVNTADVAGPVFCRNDGSTRSVTVGMFTTNNLRLVVGATTVSGSIGIETSTWRFVVAGRLSGVGYLYVDAALIGSGAATDNVTQANAKLNIGHDPSGGWGALSSTMSLLRVSATFPSAEQIKHIYETERPMFEANAQCCLAGTSNAVTALAYDDETDLLHVGTSYGRSAFKGLVRVSSEATPVGAITALAAGAGIVVQGGASGADVYVPAYTLREELLRDAEQMARFGQNLIAHDFTATASQTTFTLPVGWEIVAVYQQGAIKRETTSWTRSFDGFKWSAVLGTGATVSDWISILAKRV